MPAVRQRWENAPRYECTNCGNGDLRSCDCMGIPDNVLCWNCWGAQNGIEIID